MVEQGYSRGSCLTKLPNGKKKLACNTTLRKNGNEYERLIKSVLLSRPEDYLSIYQSGCNHNCQKCHSHEFSKVFAGQWMSSSDIAALASEYRKHVTVFEPKEAATSWHAQRLCKHCGSCFLTGKRPEKCPKKLKKGQIVFSPQGFGPARNIIAFTGGDVLCKPEFYIEVARKIKAQHDDLWILLETNGYGLTSKNLESYANGGIDAFWLDIKAYSPDIYKKLCGTTNQHILDSVANIVDLGFTLEILTLYIPRWVETDEHVKIARLISQVKPTIPTTLLAFFPCYKLSSVPNRPPTPEEMSDSFLKMQDEGLQNLRLGNIGTFVKNENDNQFMKEKLGPQWNV
jgi:pyruvate-formate lyase-activating enzyme